MNTKRETLDNLNAWHWEFGAHRMGRFNLPTHWVLSLSDINEGHIPSRDQQREIGFWGHASQYSASYMKNAFGSCLAGYGDETSIFEGSSADKSGIAMRFSTALDMPKTETELTKVNFMNLSDMLASLALGYAHFTTQKDLVDPDIIEAMASAETTTTGLDAEATDLLHATLKATDVLVNSGLERFKKLRSARVWDNRLSGLVSRNPDFRKRPKLVENLLSYILWDKDKNISSFFNSLRKMRLQVETTLNGRPLFVTNDVLKLILSPDDKFISLDTRLDRRKPKEAQKISEKIHAIDIVETDTYCYLELTKKPANFFTSETEFAVFVGMIKEVAKLIEPDAKGQLGKSTVSYFNAYDIVDLPKPGLDFTKYDQGREWSLESPRGDEGMARRLLKHGKAQAAVAFKSPEFATCIFITSPDFNAPPAITTAAFTERLSTVHVIGGLDAILAGDTGPFSDAINHAATIYSPQHNDVPVIGLAVGDGSFTELDPHEQDKAADAAASSDGFKQLFPDAEAEKSLFSCLVRDDGGMGLVLEALTSSFARRTSIGRNKNRYAEDVLQTLINQALPASNIEKTDHKDAFLALAAAIEAFCLEPEKLSDQRASVVTISEKLREAFSLRPEDLDAVPRRIGSDHNSASTYVNNQLVRWATHDALDTVFDLVNLAPYHRSEISRSIQTLVPVDEVGIWLTQEFGDIGANREALHCRRYVATRLSKEIFDLTDVRIARASEDYMALQEQLDIWARPTAVLEESLHYQVVVAPMLHRFREIAEMTPKTVWVKQPGDEEIKLIAQSLNAKG